MAHCATRTRARVEGAWTARVSRVRAASSARGGALRLARLRACWGWVYGVRESFSAVAAGALLGIMERTIGTILRNV